MFVAVAESVGARDVAGMELVRVVAAEADVVFDELRFPGPLTVRLVVVAVRIIVRPEL